MNSWRKSRRRKLKAKPLVPEAAARAQQVLSGADVRSPLDIDVEALAAKHGAWAVYGPMQTARASIVRTKERAVIWVDERTRGAPWARFTIAHELGHHLLHAAEDHFEQCTGETGSGARFQIEKEADSFSAELLMPEAFAKPLANRSPRPHLEDVESFARLFRTSLTASAIRYVQLTRAPCAVVMSKEGRIQWASESASFPGKIVMRRALHEASAAARVSAQRVRGDGRPREVAEAAWGGSGRGAFIEQAVLLSRLPGGDAVGAVGHAHASSVVSWVVA